jgi:hypothetical protein
MKKPDKIATNIRESFKINENIIPFIFLKNNIKNI